MKVFEGIDWAKGTDRGYHVVTIGPAATQEDVQALRDAFELGCAWAEAEAALPEKACGLSITAQGDWGVVRNWVAWTYAPGASTISGNGPAPAAALRALAAKLREGAR